GRSAERDPEDTAGRALRGRPVARPVRGAGDDQLPLPSHARRRAELRWRGAAVGRARDAQGVSQRARGAPRRRDHGARPQRERHEVSQYSPEETAAAVAEAHNAGLRITTHAHGSGGMRVAAEAGIDSIEHATLLDERTVRVIKERDVAIVPTLLVVQSLLDHA